MFKEEQILFPFVIRLEESVRQNPLVPFARFGTVNHRILMMLLEHDEAGELLLELRKLSGGYRVPDDAGSSYQTFYQSLETFEENLHQHIHLENNILFPKAMELMSYLVPQVRENGHTNLSKHA
jgi:regulator of cell morphogenesis and NO signaling